MAGVTAPFISAIWDYPDILNTALVIAFGTESGLKVPSKSDVVKRSFKEVMGLCADRLEALQLNFLFRCMPKKPRAQHQLCEDRLSTDLVPSLTAGTTPGKIAH